MRAIQFPSGTRESTKEVVGSLAWATNRRGGARNGWQSENVVRSILQYFRDNNVEVPDATQLSNVLNLLVTWGYAERRFSGTGKRTLEFKFLDDVSLTGFSPVTRVNGQSSTVPAILAPREAARGGATLPPSQRPTRSQFGPRVHEAEEHLSVTEIDAPPLPFHDRELLPPLYRFDELEEELREWCSTQEGADAYAIWIDAVIDQFQRKKENNT